MDQIKKAMSVSLPPLAVGYFMALLLLAGALAIGILWPQAYQAVDEQGETTPAEAILTLVWLVGFIYWLICVHRIHKVIFELTGSTYPITPARAVWFHFIPFYNLYWVFKWPSEVIKFINVNTTAKQMKPNTPGILLLLGFLIGDGIGLILMFLALKGMVHNIKTVLQFPAAQTVQS